MDAIGFSAGVYLVANMSNTVARTYPLTHAADRQSPRPDDAVFAYTARTLDNSRGRNSLEVQARVTINPKAPPTLLLHAMDDPIDGVRQPLAYALALGVRAFRSTSGYTPAAGTPSNCDPPPLPSRGAGRGR